MGVEFQHIEAPALHSAAISTRMAQELGGATVIGPLIVGLEKPVQIVSLGAKDSDIVNMAALASFDIGGWARLGPQLYRGAPLGTRVARLLRCLPKIARRGPAETVARNRGKSPGEPRIGVGGGGAN